MRRCFHKVVKLLPARKVCTAMTPDMTIEGSTSTSLLVASAEATKRHTHVKPETIHSIFKFREGLKLMQTS